MNLIDEAVIIEIFGIRMYAFGAYVAVGALCSLLTMLMLRKAFDLKTGTVPLTFLLSAICGVVVSRLAFCLLNQELGRMMPLYSWFQAPGGGWSMFGLIGGVFLGGWISSKIMKEKAGSIMDMLSLSILPLIVAERIGENRIEDFDISRVLQSQAIANSFLATGDEYTRALKTYYVAAAVCAVIFAVLLLTFMRRKKNGDVAVMFLLIFGAASIILESLRYDFFLSIRRADAGAGRHPGGKTQQQTEVRSGHRGLYQPAPDGGRRDRPGICPGPDGMEQDHNLYPDDYHGKRPCCAGAETAGQRKQGQ